MLRRYWHFLAVSLLALAQARIAFALSYVLPTDEALADQSEGVLVGTIVKVLPERDWDAQTTYVVEVDRWLVAEPGRAKASTRFELLVLPGTTRAPNVNAVVQGVPHFDVGESVLIMSERKANGVVQPMQLSLGIFKRVSVNGDGRYIRYLLAENQVSKVRGREQFLQDRDADRFEEWLADRARGVLREPDYLISRSAGIAPKFTFSEFNFMTPGPGRWFQFDSLTSLPWTASPDGQANTTFNEFTSLQSALAAWTNDATSRIVMNYAGTSADANNCALNPNTGSQYHLTGHVCWNDPGNRIAGSFDCVNGGTLAIGGSFAFSNGQMFNGMLWYPRAIAFVIVQDNAGCSMDDNAGADGAELLTHEVGHSIAFGHSCGDASSPACGPNPVLNQAVMRALLHGDGRGASLGADDIAGAAVAYPEPMSNVGPTITANSPASGSTTAMSGGTVGAQVTRNITFNVSGGSGAGTTDLVCQVNSGTVAINSGASQLNIPVGGSTSPVVARFTLTGSAQAGQIGCTATPDGGSVANFTYNFTAPAGTPATPCTGGRIIKSGFENAGDVACP